MKFIEEEYLGEIKADAAIVERPDLFERAFLSIFGKVGEIILREVCDEVRAELGIKTNVHYSKRGDFARCISAIPVHSDS